LPLPSSVLELPDQLLLFGIDRDDRLPSLQGRLDFGIDKLELGLPVWMTLALDRLTIGLQAIAEFVQQCGHHAMAGRMPEATEFLSQLAHTFAGPAQGRFGVPPGHGIDQAFKIDLECVVHLSAPLATASGAPETVGWPFWRGMQFRQPGGDCPPRNSCRPRDCRDPAPADRGSLSSGEQSARPFVEERSELLKSCADGSFVVHTARIISDA
jgi:hypothetical protein